MTERDLSERYTFRAELGRGGMGVVNLVFDAVLGEEVAMKRLLRDEAASIVRFKREFRRLEKLRHPNLVHLYELGTDDEGALFFTMEHVRGAGIESACRAPAGAPDAATLNPTPTELLPAADRGALTRTLPPTGAPPTVASRAPHARSSEPRHAGASQVSFARLDALLAQLADALAHLHAHGVVHRDIKPSNVRVTPDGVVKLLDFGIVGEVGAVDPARGYGTPGFISPEQIRGDAPSPANDAYGLGCLIYTLVTGRPVFGGSEATQLQRHLREPPPRLRDAVPDVPAHLDDLCARLLAKTPAERATVDDVRLALRSQATSISAQPPAAPRMRSLVGRGALVQRLTAEGERARGGEFRAVVLAGPPGVGKTALAQNACAAASARGAIVLEGRGRPTDRVPFNALDGAMDALAAALEASDVRSPGMARLRAAASIAFPVLAQSAPRDPATAAAESRADVFSAVAALIALVAERTSVTLFVDDLQWADDDSLALLRSIVDAAPPRALLLGTLRDDADDTPAAVWLRSAVAVDVLPIEPLDERSMHELIAALATEYGEPSAPDRVALAVAACAGRPYLAAIVAHALVTRGDAAVSTSQALLARAVEASVTPQSRALLTLLVARDQWVAIPDLAAVLGLTIGEVQTLADTLEARGVVRRAGGTTGPAQLAIFHDMMTAALREVLPHAEIAAAHRRLAMALEAAGASSPHRLVRHWLGAGEPRRAVGYARAAADSALEKRAYGLAAEMFGVLRAHSPDREGDLAALHASALGKAGRGLEAGRAFEESAARAHAMTALERRRRAADQYLRAGHVDEGSRVLDGVLEAARVPSPRTRAGSLLSYLWTGWSLRLRGLRYQPKDRDTIPIEQLLAVESCWTGAVGYSMTDQVRGMDFQMRAVRMALEAGESSMVARALALAAGPAAAGHPVLGPSDGLLGLASAAAAASGSDETRDFVTMCAGSVAYLEGRWNDAVPLLSSVEERFRERAGASWEVGVITVNSAWSLALLGRFEDLARWAHVQQRSSSFEGNVLADVALSSGWPNARWLVRGEPARARQEASRVVGHGSLRGFHLQHLCDLVAQVHVDFYEGRDDDAAARVDAALPRIDRSGLLRVRTNAILVHDLVARTSLASLVGAASGDAAQGDRRRAVRAAVRALQRSSQSWALGAAAMAEAGLAFLGGDASRACDRLRAGAAVFEACGMRLHAAVAHRTRGLIEGDEAAALASVEPYVRAEGVADLAALSRLVAPWAPVARIPPSLPSSSR